MRHGVLYCVLSPSACITTYDCDTMLTTIKSFGGLRIASRSLVDLLVVSEKIFRSKADRLITADNVEQYLVSSISSVFKLLPQCHSSLIIRRYIRLRLHAFASSASKGNHDPQYASKSAACRTLIK